MKKVIIINGESLGRGAEDLGQKLMGTFLRKLWAGELKPAAIVCYNSAVKLMTDGSNVLDALTALEEAGVDILACGTCVDYYQLEDKLQVGRISNMEEIAAMLMTADSVVTV
jgi:DsrE/DsrF-like family.